MYGFIQNIMYMDCYYGASRQLAYAYFAKCSVYKLVIIKG